MFVLTMWIKEFGNGEGPFGITLEDRKYVWSFFLILMKNY